MLGRQRKAAGCRVPLRAEREDWKSDGESENREGSAPHHAAIERRGQDERQQNDEHLLTDRDSARVHEAGHDRAGRAAAE